MSSEKEAKNLLDVLGKKKKFVVVMHDNPDPDAVSSALALSMLAREAGAVVRLVARGTIGFEENRILLEALGAHIEMVDGIFTPSDEGTALVDCYAPGENNPLDPRAVPDIIIDHHSTSSNGDGTGFIKMDPNRGAASSIMVDYLVALSLEPSPELAAGLYYGIMVDTHGFVWNMKEKDFRAVEYLSKILDKELLKSLREPLLDVETLDVLGRAIQNREVRDGFSMSCVDYIKEQDSIARSADFLLRQRGVHTSLVYGIMDKHIYASSRTSREDLDMGDVMRRAFSDFGFAGGHMHSAGARLPVGILGFADMDKESERYTVVDIIKRAVTSRFLNAVGYHLEK
ncbi:MAG: bifunctional oligoribonuclease/PAP phosphatase NrnA [Candidatus Thermoplasmatota archaeon]|nr:bifunctional oligoribonuclease/PAP phosphatase NrnA [Candidatus Thermoplasmatota archaeon]